MTRQSPLLIALLALVTLGCEDSIRLTYLPEPPAATKLTVTPEQVKALEAKHPGKDGVYLEQDFDYEIVTSPSLESVRARNYTYVVLNRSNESLASFSVRVPSGAELEGVFLIHRRPQGETKTYGRSDLKEEKDSNGSRTLKFIYPNVEKGSVISEHYLIRTPNPRPGDLLDYEAPLQWELPCESVRLRFLHPEAWTGRLKELGPNRTLPCQRTVSPAGKKVIYTYEAKDVAGLDEEPFSPFFKERANYFKFAFTSVPSFHYRGSESWPEFQRDFAAYAVDKEAIISQRVQTTAMELTRNCTTDEQRLDAIVTFVQNTITPGPLPNNPNFADMLATKHGNIFQATGLARSMLTKVGIYGDFVMMHSQRDGYFDPAFISFEEVATPGLRVTLGKQTFVVFPWVKNLPVNHLPEPFQGAKALVISAGALQGTFIDLPEGNIATNTWEERYEVALDTEGRATVKEEKVLHGSSAFGVRQGLKDLNPTETEKLLKKLLTYTEGEVKFTSVGFEHREEPKQPLVIKLTYTVDNLVSVTPDEVIFNTGGLFAPSSSLKTKVDTALRQSPIRIYYDEARVKKVALTFPKTWKLDTPLKDQSLETPFGSLSMALASEPGRIQVDQTLRFRKASAAADQFDKLLPLTGRRSQMAIPTLVFKTSN